MTLSPEKALALSTYMNSLKNSANAAESFERLYVKFDSDAVLLFQSAPRQALLGLLRVIRNSDALQRRITRPEEVLRVLQFLSRLPDAEERVSALTLVLEMVTAVNAADLWASQPLLVTVVQLILSESVELSEAASLVAEKCLISTPTLLPQFSSMCDSHSDDPIFQIRFYAVAARVISSGESQFMACRACGLVEKLRSLCSAADSLLQAVALEFTRAFADTRAGFSYLVQSGLLGWLVEQSAGESGSAEDEDEASLGVAATACLREASEVFAHATRSGALDSATWALLDPALLQRLQRGLRLHLGARAEDARLAGLNATANFACAAPEALQLLLRPPTEGESVAVAWCSLLSGGKSELQAATLHSLALVMEHRYEVENEGILGDVRCAATVVALKAQLLRMVGAARGGGSPLSQVMRFVRTPVAMIRQGALDLLRGLVAGDTPPGAWGLTAVCGEGLLREYLLDQERDPDPAGRQWRYSLLEALATHPQLEQATAHLQGDGTGSFVEAVRRMYARGPHYRPTQQAELLTLEH